MPRLDGAIELRNVTIRDSDGKTILEDLDLTIPHGARVAIQSSHASERSGSGSASDPRDFACSGGCDCCRAQSEQLASSRDCGTNWLCLFAPLSV